MHLPRRLSAIIPLTAIFLPITGVAAESHCTDFPSFEVGSASRPIEPEDLIRLRDIGETHTSISSAAIAASPDGRKVAFHLRQADLERNGYCTALIVADVEGSGEPAHRVVDRGDGLLTRGLEAYGLKLPTRTPRTIAPAWSPDGAWIAYLKTVDGVTQVWGARSDGTPGRALTSSAIDVESFAWSVDGEELLFEVDETVGPQLAEIEAEGAHGFHFDARFRPSIAPRPLVRRTGKFTAYAVDVNSGRTRQAVFADEESSGDRDAPAEALQSVVASDGAIGWTIKDEPRALISRTRLYYRTYQGREVVCDTPECGDIIALWWSDKTEELVFLSWSGEARDQAVLRAWTPGAGDPRQLYEARGVLIGCTPAGSKIVCAQEDSLRPRHLITIDIATGRDQLLFDPNPEIGSFRLGTVRRLYWTNAFGIEAFGDLLLPPDHETGKAYPLILTSYESRGFLRGGTGDEFPILPFASRGFAVLNLHRPRSAIATLPTGLTTVEIERANLEGWIDRRSVQSSLEEGVRAAVATGAIDEKRIGITGLSEGSAIAWYGLLNSSLFAAASISHCCPEPGSYLALGGIGPGQIFRDVGYPNITSFDDEFWRRISVVQNADRLDVPILMHLSEHEFLTSVVSVSALREHQQPVDVYVFPREGHVKLEPVHRLAMYRRNLDWFDYWLRDERTDDDPVRRDELERWEQMRASRAGVQPDGSTNTPTPLPPQAS